MHLIRINFIQFVQPFNRSATNCYINRIAYAHTHTPIHTPLTNKSWFYLSPRCWPIDINIHPLQWTPLSNAHRERDRTPKSDDINDGYMVATKTISTLLHARSAMRMQCNSYILCVCLYSSIQEVKQGCSQWGLYFLYTTCLYTRLCQVPSLTESAPANSWYAMRWTVIAYCNMAPFACTDMDALHVRIWWDRAAW